MSKKLPAIQFYTGDWLKDSELSLCSTSTRGVWMDLLCRMHESGRSGIVTGTVEQLCRLCRATPAEITLALDELSYSQAAVVSQRNGIFTIINRRMNQEYKDREATAKRVANYRNNKNVTNGNSDVTNTQNTENKRENKKKRESNGNVTSYSSISSSSSVTNLNNGSGSNARARGKTPPSAANFESSGQRQWIELDSAEKIMSLEDFKTHLQRLHPKKNVRAIAKKLKQFCDDNDKTFALERLKGWVAGESESISEEEFLAAFGDDEKKPSLAQQCTDCDVRGLVEVTVEGVKRMAKCRHENLKGKL